MIIKSANPLSYCNNFVLGVELLDFMPDFLTVFFAGCSGCCPGPH